jgi:hypothetical protein
LVDGLGNAVRSGGFSFGFGQDVSQCAIRGVKSQQISLSELGDDARQKDVGVVALADLARNFRPPDRSVRLSPDGLLANDN